MAASPVHQQLQRRVTVHAAHLVTEILKLLFLSPKIINDKIAKLTYLILLILTKFLAINEI